MKQSTKTLSVIGEDPGVAAFVRMCIATAKKSSGMSVTDAIVKTSKRENLNYHLGYFEFYQARSALIKRIRFAKEATLFDRDGNGVNAIPRGEDNDLLGKKIFVDQDRGKKPTWAGHTNAFKSEEDTPSGRNLPIVREFLAQQTAMLMLDENDYTDEWVESKITAKPAIRDTDLQIAIDAMKRSVTNLKDNRTLKLEVADLRHTVTLLTQERHREAAIV